ncbi:hypothetical protein [Streptacidiphilus rugosus]|uniref:hypothetical protein n=1 Tax=Streptacidiphilus rugosus TaxID=405783 RepID=UPI0005691554|nr:hypothetical protein [Streptacidiphilus rugosus]
MTTTNYQPAPPSPERLDQIREALARLANPDVAFARPHTWAAMLRDTMAGLDQLTAQLAADRPAYRLLVGDISCGYYAALEAAQEHAMDVATTAEGLPLKDPHWVPESGEEDAAQELCHVDGHMDSVGTGYRIRPVTIHAAYDPAAAW